MTDKRIETYLQKSTRGLWGKKREEVREELSSHIHGRVHAHLVGGLCESDAVEKTLIELGQPAHVSAGMARLYTLPIVAGSGMVLAMCCALVVVSLSGSTAQTLNTVNVIPANECLEPQGELPQYCEIYDNFTTFETLKQALQEQGATTGSVGNSWTLRLPDNHVLVLPESGSQTWMMGEENGKEITVQTRPEYLSINNLVRSIPTSSAIPLEIRGWESPTLYLGDVTLKISSASQAGGAKKFYFQRLADSILSNKANFYGSAVFLDSKDIESERKRFEIAGEKDAVYGIAIVLDPAAPSGKAIEHNYDLAYFNDIAIANADGSVTFEMRLPDEGLNLKGKVSELSSPGDAAIVRLTGKLDKQGSFVIPPDQITLE
jgi:hypothetical protein